MTDFIFIKVDQWSTSLSNDCAETYESLLYAGQEKEECFCYKEKRREKV